METGEELEKIVGAKLESNLESDPQNHGGFPLESVKRDKALKAAAWLLRVVVVFISKT